VESHLFHRLLREKEGGWLSVPLLDGIPVILPTYPMATAAISARYPRIIERLEILREEVHNKVLLPPPVPATLAPRELTVKPKHLAIGQAKSPQCLSAHPEWNTNGADLDICDDMYAEVFRRLDHVDLATARCVCKRWAKMIDGASSYHVKLWPAITVRRQLKAFVLVDGVDVDEVPPAFFAEDRVDVVEHGQSMSQATATSATTPRPRARLFIHHARQSKLISQLLGLVTVRDFQKMRVHVFHYANL